jgi:hypothetical protein
VRAGNLPNYAFYTPNMFNDGHDASLESSSHYRLLRTIVDSFGLESVGAGDRRASSLPDKVWK